MPYGIEIKSKTDNSLIIDNHSKASMYLGSATHYQRNVPQIYDPPEWWHYFPHYSYWYFLNNATDPNKPPLVFVEAPSQWILLTRIHWTGVRWSVEVFSYGNGSVITNYVDPSGHDWGKQEVYPSKPPAIHPRVHYFTSGHGAPSGSFGMAIYNVDNSITFDTRWDSKLLTIASSIDVSTNSGTGTYPYSNTVARPASPSSTRWSQWKRFKNGLSWHVDSVMLMFQKTNAVGYVGFSPFRVDAIWTGDHSNSPYNTAGAETLAIPVIDAADYN